jgi:hypothetical protein
VLPISTVPICFNPSSRISSLELCLYEMNVIGYNVLTKEYSIPEKYVTRNIEYLPISTYCVWLFYISVIALAESEFTQYRCLMRGQAR